MARGNDWAELVPLTSDRLDTTTMTTMKRKRKMKRKMKTMTMTMSIEMYYELFRLGYAEPSLVDDDCVVDYLCDCAVTYHSRLSLLLYILQLIID